MAEKTNIETFVKDIKSWQPEKQQPRFAILSAIDGYGLSLYETREQNRRNHLTFEDVESVLDKHLQLLRIHETPKSYFNESHKHGPKKEEKKPARTLSYSQTCTLWISF